MGSANLPAPSVQDQLAALAQRYADQLPGKVAEMRALLQALLAEGWDQARGETLHRMVHSLAGSGGTMGLHQVSYAARQLEQILKRATQGETSLVALQAEISTGLDRLNEAIALREQASAPSVSSVAASSHIAQIEPLKILVVDDDPVGQALLTSFLKADGHAVMTASDGIEGVARFKEAQPDLVFMDVLMPKLNGYEAARQIKSACGKQFVPLIFLTALQDENDLAQCIAAGGDDFIVKPYNRVLLKAKLIAMQRIRKLHQELARYQQRTAEEIDLSQHVFESITNHNPKLDAVMQWHSAVGHFSGDIVLYGMSPTGRLVLMLGDFTGHGLGAALAAVPASDLFYSLVEDEVSLPDLVLAVNRKLKDILPTGRFCAALLLSITPGKDYIDVWNGGIPGAYGVDATGRILHRIASTKLPLGVLGDQGFDPQPERLALAPGEQLLFFSDGLNEARNPQGEMLGIEGAEHLFLGQDVALLARLVTGVAQHLGAHEADDDITIAVISPDKFPAPRR